MSQEHWVSWCEQSSYQYFLRSRACYEKDAMILLQTFGKCFNKQSMKTSCHVFKLLLNNHPSGMLVFIFQQSSKSPNVGERGNYLPVAFHEDWQADHPPGQHGRESLRGHRRVRSFTLAEVDLSYRRLISRRAARSSVVRSCYLFLSPCELCRAVHPSALKLSCERRFACAVN